MAYPDIPDDYIETYSDSEEVGCDHGGLDRLFEGDGDHKGEGGRVEGVVEGVQKPGASSDDSHHYGGYSELPVPADSAIRDNVQSNGSITERVSGGQGGGGGGDREVKGGGGEDKGNKPNANQRKKKASSGDGGGKAAQPAAQTTSRKRGAVVEQSSGEGGELAKKRARTTKSKQKQQEQSQNTSGGDDVSPIQKGGRLELHLGSTPLGGVSSTPTITCPPGAAGGDETKHPMFAIVNSRGQPLVQGCRATEGSDTYKYILRSSLGAGWDAALRGGKDDGGAVGRDVQPRAIGCEVKGVQAEAERAGVPEDYVKNLMSMQKRSLAASEAMRGSTQDGTTLVPGWKSDLNVMDIQAKMEVMGGIPSYCLELFFFLNSCRVVCTGTFMNEEGKLSIKTEAGLKHLVTLLEKMPSLDVTLTEDYKKHVSKRWWKVPTFTRASIELAKMMTKPRPDDSHIGDGGNKFNMQLVGYYVSEVADRQTKEKKFYYMPQLKFTPY